MSLRNTIAKLYVRAVFRDEGPFDPLKTQKEHNVRQPPRSFSARCVKAAIKGVDAFWIDEANAVNGILAYLHGGAYYFGPVKEQWYFIASMCKRVRMAALVIDFRNAPQHPFPAALNDIVKAVTLCVTADKWYFLGDSSGAGLALSAHSRLRETGGPVPQKILLMSPWVDATLTNPAIALNENEDPMMTKERLSNAASIYAGTAELSDPLISPTFADLASLPPLLIQMGTADLLLWDCRKFYMKCLDAGVNVRYEEYPSAFHDFMMLSFIPEAKRAQRSQIEFLTRG